MSAEYMHVGIPVLNKKPNMVFNEWGGFLGERKRG